MDRFAIGCFSLSAICFVILFFVGGWTAVAGALLGVAIGALLGGWFLEYLD